MMEEQAVKVDVEFMISDNFDDAYDWLTVE